jgi:hypothetical protein
MEANLLFTAGIIVNIVAIAAIMIQLRADIRGRKQASAMGNFGPASTHHYSPFSAAKNFDNARISRDQF